VCPPLIIVFTTDRTSRGTPTRPMSMTTRQVLGQPE
jgi:hypothetical protein